MRIALFNDTGRYPHVGCRAVSSGHDRMLARAGLTVVYRSYHGEWRDLVHRLRTRRVLATRALKERLADLTAVIVNGEGTIHHFGGRHLLAILRMAQAMRLQTYLVNAVLQALDPNDLDVLHRLTGCTVRDAYSSAYLAGFGIPHTTVFDALIEADFAEHPAVDLGGRIVVTDWHGSRRFDVGVACRKLLKDLGEDAVFYPLQHVERAAHWFRALADLRAARVIVTGRHHGVCLAALAGVPFVALGSNTWKVEGLLHLMPGQLRLCDPREDLRAACAEAEQQIERAIQLRRWVKKQRPLKTFDALMAVAA